VADEEVDEEEAAIRAIDDPNRQGPEAPPLCSRCQRRQHVFWTDDSRDCPLCKRGRRSGSWVICEDCAKEAAVCVFDCLPLDGTSDDPVPWLAEVVDAARRAREQEQFGSA
jgi:hypothetical protein